MTKKEKEHRGETQTIAGGRGEIVIYQTGEGGGRLEARLKQDSLWLSLNQIAAVFERDKSVISRHLSNVFREGELDRGSTVAFFATVQDEGGLTVERQVEYFNLDVILSVGYRVNSKRGTQFRIWATQVLRDHLVKGYSGKRLHIFSIFSSRTTVSWTETSALAPPCFSGSWRRTASFTAPTVPGISPTTRWSPSR